MEQKEKAISAQGEAHVKQTSGAGNGSTSVRAPASPIFDETRKKLFSDIVDLVHAQTFEDEQGKGAEKYGITDADALYAQLNERFAQYGRDILFPKNAQDRRC